MGDRFDKCSTIAACEPRVPAVAPWHAAVEKLKTDADALLPQ
jgi:hypothetical protein